MADQRRHPMKYTQERGQNDEEERTSEQNSDNRSQLTPTQASTTPASRDVIHTPMEVDTRDRHTSVQTPGTNSSGTDSQLTTRPSVNVVDTNAPTQVGDKSQIIYNITNNHNHFHYSCPPPPHHHGDSSSSYHVPCPDCLPYHHNDHPPLAETHRPQPESESRHLGLSHHPVPQLPSSQQTQQMESSQSRDTSDSEKGAQNNNHPAKRLNQDKVLPKSSTSPSVASRDVTYQATTGQDQEKLAVRSKDKPKPRDSKPRSQETIRQTSRASDVTPRPNVTGAEERVRQEARTGKTADREKKENGQSQNTKTASESVETRREFNEGVRDSVCILDSAGRALEPGDGIWMGHQYGTRAIYVGNQEVVCCRGRDMMVVKEELAMTDPFGKLTVISGECQVYPPRQRVERAKAWIGEKFNEGVEWRNGFDFLVWVFTGLGLYEAWNKGFRLDYYL